MNEEGRGSNSVVGLAQSPNHSSKMHVQLKEHHKCPHCPRLFTTVQGLGSHLRTHVEINLQQAAIQEGRSVVVALPASATAPKFITNQEALAPNNQQLQKLDPDTASPETHESEAHYPRLVDFMKISKHGEKMISSANKRTNSELMELRQAEQGQEVPIVNTNLTLNPEGIDLTLRL